MPNRIALFAALFLTACAGTGSDASNSLGPGPAGNVYQVYFLGGQSNMEGFGYVKDLPEILRIPADNTAIFHGRSVPDGEDGGGVGYWSKAQPGHGFKFDTDGKNNALSDRFGPEVSFAYAMTRLKPEKRIAIIKYTRGGTALVDGVSGFGSWDPDYTSGNGRSQLDHALTTIENALKPNDIDGDGRIDRLEPVGIVWMQGEADAFDSVEASSEYAVNLGRVVRIFRKALSNPKLPVVLGRIKDSGNSPETRVMKFSPIVREQQAKFVEQDACSALVTVSDDFAFLPDKWHYTSRDYVMLGSAFAEAVVDLQETCT